MSLRESQSIFALNFARLIVRAYELGYEITYGEGQRTNSQQLLHYYGYEVEVDDTDRLILTKTYPRSKTLRSKHIKKLAHDIYLFKNGKLLSDKESFKPLAEYWRSLHPKNSSGSDWNPAWDLGHFQMSE